MTDSTPDIRTLRMAVLEARIAHGDAQRALMLREATLRCNLSDEKGGAKNIGANEQEREDRFRLHFVEDGAHQTCRETLREAERALALAEAELEAAYFALRSREADATPSFARLRHEQVTPGLWFTNSDG